MDLALEFGVPIERLKRNITEREVRQWMHYASRRMLPQRRIELYLAQVAWQVSRVRDAVLQSAGARSVQPSSLSDFLFDADRAQDDDQDDDEVDDVQAARDFFGFNPRTPE
jgi:hypothetical protein